MMTRVATFVTCIALGACVTVGKEVTQEQLSDFKRGVTTQEEIVAKLGRPTSSTISASGDRYMSYVFAHSQARPATFIPIVGAFAGGADTRSSHVMFIFDRDGKLRDYRATESNLGSGHGLAGGAYQEPNQDQPSEAPKSERKF